MSSRFAVIVCGGRDFKDAQHVFYWLGSILAPGPQRLTRDDLTLVLGGARGADTIAEDWAKLNLIPYKVYPAEWDKYGKSAGIRRNLKMLQEGKPHLVISFKGGAGTSHMCAIADTAGVPVLRIPYPSRYETESGQKAVY